MHPQFLLLYNSCRIFRRLILWTCMTSSTADQRFADKCYQKWQMYRLNTALSYHILTVCETSLIPTPVSADWCLYDFFIFLFWWLIWRKSICTRFIAHTILLYSHLHSSRVTSVRRLELFFPPPLPSLPFSMPNLNFSWNLCNVVFTGLKMALNSCKHFFLKKNPRRIKLGKQSSDLEYLQLLHNVCIWKHKKGFFLLG